MALDDTDESCPICLDISPDPVKSPACLHTFCRECLREWCKSNNTCPNCRDELYDVATIPAKRLINIPEDFYDQLLLPVLDREEVQWELEDFARNMRRFPEHVMAPAVGSGLLLRLVSHHFAIQSVLLGAVIWCWNKVDDDFAPHMRATFKADWIKVLQVLNDELIRRDEWEGNVGDQRLGLLNSVYPSTDEPRRYPNHFLSWKKWSAAEAWYAEHGARWASDGWAVHGMRIVGLVNFVVKSQWELSTEDPGR